MATKFREKSAPRSTSPSGSLKPIGDFGPEVQAPVTRKRRAERHGKALRIVYLLGFDLLGATSIPVLTHAPASYVCVRGAHELVVRSI
jgi:hypothetical protein